MVIADLVPGVILKLRGRTDVTPDIPGYIRSALLDITQNYEFEELRVTGPLTNFIINKSSYPKQGSECIFIQPGHISITFIVSWFCYFLQNGPYQGIQTVTPGVSTGLVLKGRSPRVVEPMSNILGQPSVYSIVGPTILVGYMPNAAYATYMRYQRQHPFNPGSQLLNSPVFIPADWQDIIEYAAAEKACDNLGMTDIGVLYHQKLYGNPMKKYPGLIMERLSQQDRNTAYNEKQLRPVVRRYMR